ncbi:MAG: hypothetical protein ACLP7P_09910 [Rhodomicrobium sp.]
MKKLLSLLSLSALAAGLLCTSASAEWVRCAEEHGYCAIPYPTIVRYGAHGTYTNRRIWRQGVPCANGVFGDPLVGVVKHCDFWAR